MRRSKAFFVAAIKNNRKRMLATFEQAKKHTKQLLENNSQMRKNILSLRGNDILKKFVDFWDVSLLKTKSIYRSGITQIGAFSMKNVDIPTLIQNISKRGKHFFSETYSRFVIRGEYTGRSLMILFVLAFSFGVAMKVIAVQGVTIGFEDYTLAPHETLYDINSLQQKIIDRGDTLSQNSLPEGKVCSEAE